MPDLSMPHSSKLFSPLTIRDVTLRNRLIVSPMCQYSAVDGVPGAWHMTHYGSRAVGGAGMVIVEATAVTPEGRISPVDTGLWNARQSESFKPIVAFMAEHGAVPGIQLAHAGRKASTAAPWHGGAPLASSRGGWETLAPSALAFGDYPSPKAMSLDDLASTRDAFVSSARLALDAGFQVIEIHMAHGYLLHEFLSPLSNQRQDQFGGAFENRIRFPLEVAQAVREAWPSSKPLFVRVSASDWMPGGWNIEETIKFSAKLRDIGIDLIDTSSGGLVPDAKIPAAPLFQVPFARRIRNEANIMSGAVGLITTANEAETVLADGDADVVLMARQFLRDPYFALHAAKELGAEIKWPRQMERGR